ncbi:MAG: acylneuraminate cytidylyltransferase family protein [Bacteroidota bacterium]
MNIAFVPARIGSKSIPEKNIKIFCGKPLIYWTIKALLDANIFDKIYIATDCVRISSYVNSFNVNNLNVFIRSEESATDKSPTEEVIIEFLNKVEFPNDSRFFLSQITNPFITGEIIKCSLEQFNVSKVDSMLSVVKSSRFFWDSGGQPINYDYKNRKRRQDFEGVFMENGAFYINTIENIQKFKNRLSGKIGFFEMPNYTAHEIDTYDDWYFCEYLMKKYILDL